MGIKKPIFLSYVNIQTTKQYLCVIRTFFTHAEDVKVEEKTPYTRKIVYNYLRFLPGLGCLIEIL